jgi:hypothetical protein
VAARWSSTTGTLVDAVFEMSSQNSSDGLDLAEIKSWRTHKIFLFNHVTRHPKIPPLSKPNLVKITPISASSIRFQRKSITVVRSLVHMS